jgi:DNA-binding CsgD family transcriptional regulator/tetratricopeptide (TPR) repeat protein
MMAMGSGSSGGTRLWGRERECALLDDLVSSVRRGVSRSLVVKGEAGIGKTALLAYLVDNASDLMVTRATGIESDMELAFAGLHQLCAPLLHGMDRIPPRQRDALGVVFGLADGPAPDRFMVGLAALSLMSEVAEERPLLCVVDDAQWLDDMSALTLAFVARRLLAEPIGFVFAAREPGEELQHIPHVEVRGLVNGDARALLNSAVPFILDERVRDRILVETRGNPLALVELPRGLTPTQLAGGFGLPDAHDLSKRIESSYAQRLAALPEHARLLLLVAAADPLGDPLLLERACDHLGVALSAIDATDGLLAIEERVTFRHPLVRSAAYGSASGPARREVHRALAHATDQAADPDRRAWHRAAAAASPDEEVAHELVVSAGRASARGGQAAAAAFLRRAVALTGDSERRASRALEAAQANLRAGAFEDARRLLAVADLDSLDELGRARVELVRAEIVFAERRGGDAPLLLVLAARRLEPLDLRLARDTYLDAWGAALFAGHLASPGGGLLDVSRMASTAPNLAARSLPRDRLLDGLALLFAEGLPTAAPLLRLAIADFRDQQASAEEVLRWGWLAARAAIWLWDYDSALAIPTRAVQLARDSGMLEVLGVADNVCGQSAAWAGDFELAASLAAEVHAVKEATRSRIAPYAEISLAGLRGREPEALEVFEGVIQEAAVSQQGTAVQYVHWARAVLSNGLGKYDDAITSASEAIACTPDLFVATWAMAELIEAASRVGDVERAREALTRLEARIASADADWALGLRAQSRALLNTGDAAESSYLEAIDRLRRTPMRPLVARAYLLYGEWLRRENRRVDARNALRVAHELCQAIGMEAFASRAQAELLATGERVRRRTADARDELTPQERQIAWLARDGLSNPEIGAQLFLSPRTVEWHLRKVFGKLNVRSRRELRTVLPERDLRPPILN